MTSVPSVSRSELTQRRRKLRSHRRVKLFQTVWQTIAASGLLGGLIWATTQPIWVLRESNQTIIEGNQLLSKQRIQSLLTLSYPESLLHIEPEKLARSLESQPTIVDASVTRQLFPPSLRVQIQERVPVAIALTKPLPGNFTLTLKAAAGLLDQNGVWIPIQSYASERSTLKVPNLKVIGIPEQYRPYWAQLYQVVSRSPVQITEIDCQDPGNLILKTELGIVHLGSYSTRLPAQLEVLDKMQHLNTQIKSSQIAYIDLRNIETPLVQMNQSKEVVKLDPP